MADTLRLLRLNDQVTNPERILELRSMAIEHITRNADVANALANPYVKRQFTSSFIPLDYGQQMCDLRMQERAIIEERKRLMNSWNAKLAPKLLPAMIQFKHSHPELFI